VTMPPEGEFLKAMGIDPTTVVGGTTYLIHVTDDKTLIHYTGLKISNDREALDTALAASGFDAEVKPREDAP